MKGLTIDKLKKWIAVLFIIIGVVILFETPKNYKKWENDKYLKIHIDTNKEYVEGEGSVPTYLMIASYRSTEWIVDTSFYFNKSDDFYELSLPITNMGERNAILKTITVNDYDNTQISYEVKYGDVTFSSAEKEINKVLSAKDSSIVTLKVTYTGEEELKADKKIKIKLIFEFGLEK